MYQNEFSRIVVLEEADTICNELKCLFEENSLVMLRVRTGEDLFEILRYNLNLGAICINRSKSKTAMLKRIKKTRTDVPVFLYDPEEKRDTSTLDSFLVEGSFSIHDENKFVSLLDNHLFSRYYPVELVRGIQEITAEAIASLLRNIITTVTVPYLVDDKQIDGELTSLITIDSDWGRGYMMLQIDSGSFDTLLRAAELTLVKSSEIERFRGVLGELTNMIWGRFKTRFIGPGHAKNENRIQLPILINQKKNYIFFGETTPCLSFQYFLKNSGNTLQEIVLYQKFIFNLSWDPQKFKEQLRQEKELLKSGVLEMF